MSKIVNSQVDSLAKRGKYLQIFRERRFAKLIHTETHILLYPVSINVILNLLCSQNIG